MRVSELKMEFEIYLESRGQGAAELDAEGAVAAIVDFYRTTRVEGLEEQAGDALLCNWGTCDRCDENGLSFEFEVARLCAPVGYYAGESHAETWELRLTLHFAPSPANKGLGGHFHFLDHHRVDDFRAFIDASSAMAFACLCPPDLVELSLDRYWAARSAR